MTETEQRRIELLTYTRRIHGERNVPPAVHPRYQGTYKSLYPTETQSKKSTFGSRMLLAILLFALLAVFKDSSKEVQVVVNQIERNLSLQDFQGVINLPFFP